MAARKAQRKANPRLVHQTNDLDAMVDVEACDHAILTLHSLGLLLAVDRMGVREMTSLLLAHFACAAGFLLVLIVSVASEVYETRQDKAAERRR